MTQPPLIWAHQLAEQGRAYHIDDDPADIQTPDGVKLFTPEECAELRAMLEPLTDEEREEIFAVFISHANSPA